MTPDPILALSAVCVALSLAGLYLAVRLHRLRGDLDMLMRNANHQSRDIGSTLIAVANVRAAQDHLRDDLTDLRAEYLAQARALDAHDDRLVALEETP